jgi:hypothetical protein
MARRTVTDHALPDGIYPYAIGSSDDKQQQRYYAKLANGATKRGFTTVRAASRYKKAKDSAPSTPKQTRGTLKALWPEYLRAAPLHRSGHVRGPRAPGEAAVGSVFR